jgi:hypothetical protein
MKCVIQSIVPLAGAGFRANGAVAKRSVEDILDIIRAGI